MMMAIDVSELKLSLCMNSRKIIIDKDIDENVNLELTYYINKILESDSFKDSKEPIQFIISSNGGTVYDGLSVVNQIEHLKSIGYVVQTINLCKAFSMAFVVCVVGNQRMSYKYSTF